MASVNYYNTIMAFARRLKGLVKLVFFETTFSGKATMWRNGL
jgi:hypothetical protein